MTGWNSIYQPGDLESLSSVSESVQGKSTVFVCLYSDNRSIDLSGLNVHPHPAETTPLGHASCDVN